MVHRRIKVVAIVAGLAVSWVLIGGGCDRVPATTPIALSGSSTLVGSWDWADGQFGPKSSDRVVLRNKKSDELVVVAGRTGEITPLVGVAGEPSSRGALSPDGRTLLTTADGGVRFWRIDGKGNARVLAMSGLEASLTYSGDAIWNGDGTSAVLMCERAGSRVLVLVAVRDGQWTVTGQVEEVPDGRLHWVHSPHEGAIVETLLGGFTEFRVAADWSSVEMGEEHRGRDRSLVGFVGGEPLYEVDDRFRLAGNSAFGGSKFAWAGAHSVVSMKRGRVLHVFGRDLKPLGVFEFGSTKPIWAYGGWNSGGEDGYLVVADEELFCLKVSADGGVDVMSVP